MYTSDNQVKGKVIETGGGWELLEKEIDFEARKFWRDEIALISILSGGNIKIGSDCWAGKPKKQGACALIRSILGI